MSDRARVALFLGGFAAAVIVAFAVAPHSVPQDPCYHFFADTREWLGMPNTLNVVSNAGFLAVFIAWLVARGWRGARVAQIVFFAGIFLTSLGSSYYHLDPNNLTLPWDRLGMAIAFMALLAILVQRRITPRAPLAWLGGLVAFGVASVVVSAVVDDLRLYGVAQFFPIIVLLIFIEGWLWPAAAMYAIAKACEAFDRCIFDALGGTVSGHTLKHLFAAAGIWCIWRWLELSASAERTRAAR